VMAAEVYAGGAGTTIYCPKCGQAMLVAPEHMQLTVSCPSCEKRVKPWRLAAMANRAAAEAAAAAAPSMVRPDGYARRNRWVAGALAILLGTFGVHRFYMGFIGTGVLQALLTVLSFGMLAPLVAVWAFIEGILCFCGVMRDVEGNYLSD